MNDAERIAQITARLKAATPGPWESDESPSGGDGNRVCRMDAKGQCVCCLALMGNQNEDGEWDAETSARFNADARFIAHAPDDIAWLLELVGAISEDQTPP